MNKILRAQSQAPDAKTAVTELKNLFNSQSASLILFFCSAHYDLKMQLQKVLICYFLILRLLDVRPPAKSAPMVTLNTPSVPYYFRKMNLAWSPVA
jgi:hypothetical protein